jgi:hypothetical protein
MRFLNRLRRKFQPLCCDTQILLFGPNTLGLDEIWGSTPGAVIDVLPNFYRQYPVTSWRLKVADSGTTVDQLWLVIRYSLGG